VVRLRALPRGTMAHGKRIGAGTAAVGLVLLASLALAGEETIGLQVHQAVATRGIRVELEARPGCSLAGDDSFGRARAVRFMTEFGMAIANAVAGVEISPTLTVWEAELKVVDHPAGPDERGGVRIIKSTPSLDVELMRALIRANAPSLPNFRARCTFAITVRNATPK
jgi:hypothetical protein